MHDDLHSLISKGEKALASGETLVALVHFETAARLHPHAGVSSPRSATASPGSGSNTRRPWPCAVKR